MSITYKEKLDQSEKFNVIGQQIRLVITGALVKHAKLHSGWALTNT